MGAGLPRAYRLLQRLLPQTLRDTHGADMEETFGLALDRARREGRMAVLRLWLREAWDHARTGVQLRRAAAAGPAKNRRNGDEGRRAFILTTLVDDSRHAVRAIVRQRGFFLLAALTLALGVGATTAMYSALRSVVLNPLPFPAADRLVTLSRTFGDDGAALLGLEPAHVEALRGETGLFDGIEAYSAGAVTFISDDEAERIAAIRITSGVPALMGVAPHLGRNFTPDETAGDGARVALLDHHFWRNRFGSRADVLGQTVQLNGETWTIIGVMPRQAGRPDGSLQPLDVWLPLGDASPFRTTMARLAEGVSVDAATARVDATVRGDGPLGGVARPLLEDGPLHEHLRVLMVAVVLLLLVACVNVSNLLLQRATARGSDSAVRAALGASRGRLFRQFAIESVIVGAAGAALGAVIAHAGLRALHAVRPEQLEALRNVSIDGGVLFFCVAVSGAASVLFGIAPAVLGSRARATAALGRAGRGVLGGSGRARWALVTAEIALCFALLVGAALVTASLRELSARDPGFRDAGLIALEIRLPGWRYTTADLRTEALAQIGNVVSRLPRVEAVSLATSVPPRVSIGRMGHIQVEERREDAPTAFHAVEAEPDYLRTLGVRLVAGRSFNDDDARVDAENVILTESAAARLFPGEAAVGRRFRIEGPPDLIVVGVVSDIRATGLAADAAVPMLYFPLRRPAAQMSLAVRARDIDAQLLVDIRQIVRQTEPHAVIDIATTRELLAASIARERFTTALLSTFAMLALILAAIGLYGVLSQVVVARTREIGLRMALGADASRIGVLVMRSGLLATVSGLAIGGGLAAAGIRVLRSGVFGLTEHQPGAYATAALLLFVIAVLAMMGPAQRAARMDPLRAIGVE
jgi:putative ABC transport system permease protein